MKQVVTTDSSLHNRRLSIRLLLYVCSSSLLFILIAIAVQLYAEYRSDLAGIDSRLRFVESSYVPALAASAYQLDENQLRIQLRGLLQLQDMVYARVREELKQGAYEVAEGNPHAPGTISLEIPLVYQANKPVPVGTLLVKASLDGVYGRMRERALTVAGTNILLIVPFALSILVILQFALNRHLVRMARYTQTLSLDTLDQGLSLQRAGTRSTDQDELDQLVGTINEMRLRIGEDFRLRQEAQRQLLFQKALLECVLEARIDGILITGGDNRCLFINNHFRTLWRLPPDVGPGLSAEAVFTRMEHQVADQDALQHMKAQLAQASDAVLQGEVLLLTGKVFEYSSVSVVNSEGEQIGRLWSFRDVSQRKTMEEQLRQAQKLETLGSLAGGIAHDFNNLLSPIIGYAELGLNQLTPAGPLYEELNQILKAALRASNLTRQILAFSRKQTLEVKIIDLNELIRDFLAMVQRLLGETVEVQLRVTPDPALIRADRSQIEQVLLNIAINARDAMPDGGTLTVETAAVTLDQGYAEDHAEIAAGDYVMLAISDTGLGMDAAVRQRIFEPFFTTKEPGKGTGLGLATSFGIVKQHHGHIWVYSEPGHGTTLKVYLPRVAGVPQPEEAPKDSELALHGTEQILVVEDEPLVRELVCDTLVGQGYQVVAAESPAKALERAASGGHIDLLLTDVILPQMNGRELYLQLSSRISDLKVIYMSGYIDDVIATQGMMHEGVHFIQKPFSVSVLLHKVRQVLG